LEQAATNATSMENPLSGFEIRKVPGVDSSREAQCEEIWKAGVCERLRIFCDCWQLAGAD
jgi:hypothetical protein